MLKRILSSMTSATATLAAAMVCFVLGLSHDPAHALVGISCKAPVSSVVRLEPVQSITSSVAFVNLISVNVSVPAGVASQCIKVLFTGEAGCRGPAGVNDACYIRALDNGVEMNPQGAGAQFFLTEDSSPNAHAYEWVNRSGPGNHTITIQWRVGNAATFYTMDDWTFDVSLHN